MNSTPHTSYFLVDPHLMTRTCVGQVQVSRAQCTFHITSCAIFTRSCCVFDSPRLSLPLLAVHFLSYRLVHLPSLELLLPRCGGQILCALPLMRTLAQDHGTLAEYDPLTFGKLTFETCETLQNWKKTQETIFKTHFLRVRVGCVCGSVCVRVRVWKCVCVCVRVRVWKCVCGCLCHQKFLIEFLKKKKTSTTNQKIKKKKKNISKI